jgi:ribosome hibernation promoting factor
MQITVSGRQIEVTDSLRDYAAEKIGRVQKHFDHLTTMNVVLRVEKERHLAEVTLHAKGAALAASAEALDMYAAIDELADKLDRQVLKHKEKLVDHHRDQGSPKRLLAR